MPQDDVTSPKPLRGGRQKANHIQVNRYELGLWERKNLAEPLAQTLTALNDVRKVSMIVTPVVAAGGIYVAYKVGKAAFGWVGTLTDDLEELRNTIKPVELQAEYISNIGNNTGESPPPMGLTEPVILTVLNIFGLGR